jgi:hypothetical protein
MPGERGARNSLRGDDFAGPDKGLNKTWKMCYADSHAIQFRWEVFNVPNLRRFDVQLHRPGDRLVGFVRQRHQTAHQPACDGVCSAGHVLKQFPPLND